MGRALLLLAVVWLAGCSPLQPYRSDGNSVDLRVLEEVPFVRQAGPYDCGPAALASLLEYKGYRVPIETIRRQVYTPALRGSLLPDMENFARRQGAATRSGRGDLALLRHQVDAGRPVLIPVETGFGPASAPHYMVVFGYGDADFLVHAGERESVLIAADQLLRRWTRMNRLYLYLE